MGFDPSELRDPHGQWTRGGAVLHRLAHEASAARGASGPDPKEVHARISSLPKGKRVGISGHVVDNIPSKGLRVRIKGEGSQHYDSSHSAAEAVLRGSHKGGTPAPRVPFPKEGPDYKPESESSKKRAAEAANKRQSAELAGHTLTGETRQAYGTTQYAVLRPDGRSIEWADEGSALHRAAEKNTTAKEWRQKKLGEIGHPTPPAPKAPAARHKKVAIQGLPAGYTGLDRGQKDYKGQRVVEIHHATQGHVANLEYHDYTTPVTRGRSRIASGSVRTKGYTYKLVHKDAKAGAESVREEARANTGGKYSPSTYSMLQQTLAVPLGRAAQDAIKRHNELSSKSAPKPAAKPASTESTGRDIASMAAQWQSARDRWQSASLPSQSRLHQREMRDVEAKLKAAGATFDAKTGWHKPGAATDLNKRISQVESQFREEGISYTPQDLVATRLDSVLSDLKAGDTRITIKVPSGSEVTIPRDVAIELANRARSGQQSYLRGVRR